MQIDELTEVNVRPEVGMLSVLPALNYKPWYALAEFVDNSIQSFLASRALLGIALLNVEIEYDPADGVIVIRDNAAGINTADFARAFRPGERPLDRSGLSEFGMGMKSAACWFGRRFTVRSTALGEPLERTLVFDLADIVSNGREVLRPEGRPVPTEWHFTEVSLSELYKPPQGRTVGKMKDHLASIYREFIRRGDLRLTWNGEILQYDEPSVLRAAFYKDEDQTTHKQWRKDIQLDLGQGLTVHGFAAIRQVGSTALAGFALFRRGRLIEGSGDETYRPRYIFGASNDYVFQRLFGELHLDGFQVSHTKDGFRWDENEEPFLELLKEELDKPPLPLLTQAREYRVRARPVDIRVGAEEAVDRTADALSSGAADIPEQPGPTDGADAEPPPQLPEADPVAARREFELELDARRWQVTLELVSDPAVGDWLTVSDDGSSVAPTGENIRKVGVRLSLAHPFMDRFGGTDAARIEPLLRVAAGIGVSEVLAREAGIKFAGSIRMRLNEMLRGPLARP
ncbi:MAG: ATP-binding protein [Dehalococcoidia bacterium]|nr:ATP-binding protein [Dehalococcoidia bacterium]